MVNATRLWQQLVMGACLLTIALLTSAKTHAQVAFGSNAMSTVTVITSDTMGITLDFGLIGDETFEFGDAEATTSGSQTPLGGGSFTLISRVSGFANAPGLSISEATYMNGASIRLVNTDENPRMALFRLDISYDLTAMSTNPAIGFSSTGAFFHVTGIDDEELTVDGLPAAEYLRQFSSDSDQGLPPIEGGDTVVLGVLVAPESASVFTVITDVSGRGFVLAPEPCSLLLMGLATLPLLTATRRQK